MPHSAIETLNSDLIIEILRSLPSFGDLNALINSSPVFYNLFNAYPNSILAAVAQNIVGKDVWKEAFAVLSYQRNRYFDNYIIEKDQEQNFVFGRKDIPQLLLNQKLFHSCSAPFATIAPYYYPRPGIQTPSIDALLSRRPRPLSKPGYLIPSLTDGILPIKTFYQAWAFALRFVFDSINTFANRKPLSAQQCTDFHLVLYVMFLSCDDDDDEFYDILYMGYGRFKRIRSWDLFNTWGCTAQLCASEWLGKNPILWAKLMAHLRTTTHLRVPVIHGLAEHALMGRFAADYEVKSLKDLLEKYEFSGEEVMWPRFPQGELDGI